MADSHSDGPAGQKDRAEHQGGHPKNAGGWANIASMNVSKRKKTNTLEVRLETEKGVSCSLNTEEIERLLRRLQINSSQFFAVQACPERKNLVFITFAPGIDLNKFVAECILCPETRHQNNNKSSCWQP